MNLFAPHGQYEQTIASKSGQRGMTGRQLFEIYICERARALVIRRRKNCGPIERLFHNPLKYCRRKVAFRP